MINYISKNGITQQTPLSKSEFFGNSISEKN
jgi:hypothetical protein